MKHTELYTNLVREFHTAFEQPVFKHPDDAPVEIHELRALLIDEEHSEYIAAVDRVDILDAICDLIYVVAGTAVTYSIPITGYSSTSLPLKTITVKPVVWHRVFPLLQSLYCLFPCPKMLRKECNELLDLLEDTAKIYNFKMPEAFIRVHNNNMAKLWSAAPDNPNLTARQKGNKWLVVDKNGKITKPADHTKVDLTTCV